ncbi:alpha-1,2-fucosyltransferase [Parapedobacter koreensis]|uniref:Glycosyl transferase family 11 n=1 Tax=Parapedobacter koreensis TaxID=332977 RepID=A0A1H7GEL3_9SPHI|nr:alpha-1,2-fucosyltransferase [Parapedobacter koreensis]SEK35927.1 Glycosyl transferase family 11 [Parapedobacter koreensis]
MTIVKFLGGLGNQLFQYAFYLALQKTFGNTKADLAGYDSYTLHQGFELERVFGIKLPQINDFERKLYLPVDRQWLWRKLRQVCGTKHSYWEERQLFSFDESIFREKAKRYYWGYWQHINYIRPVEDELRRRLIFPPFDDEHHEKLLTWMKGRNTVSVHIRRGDYIGDPLLGGICDTVYYKRAIDYMELELHNPEFIFFSNDIDWCKKTFAAHHALFVDWNDTHNNFRDMQLIAHCKHHIIANSSFSWWGAWFNMSPSKIVISPSRWVNDASVGLDGIILPNFIRL